jgi:hypothetical protein
MVALFFVVIVFVGPGFPFKEVCLRIEIGAGQADDMSVGIGVDDSFRVFLVQSVDALSVRHLMYLQSNFFSEI